MEVACVLGSFVGDPNNNKVSSNSFLPFTIMEAPTEKKEDLLIEAARQDQFEEILTLLQKNPGLDVNSRNIVGWTALHYAAHYDHSLIAQVLLEHPGININVRSSDGRTPLQLACHHGHLEIVQFFLGDPRTDLASADDQGCTPLWKAARWGHIEIIEWLMASGRDLGDVNGVGTWVDGQELTSLEIAKESKRLRAVSLLERFATNPTATRHEIRVKLGLQGALAAELFAVIWFFYVTTYFRSKLSPPPPPLSKIQQLSASSLWSVDCPWSCKWSSATRSTARPKRESYLTIQKWLSRVLPEPSVPSLSETHLATARRSLLYLSLSRSSCLFQEFFCLLPFNFCSSFLPTYHDFLGFPFFSLSFFNSKTLFI